MRNWLERLQQQPKAYRQRVAFGGAVAATALVAVVWSVSLPERLVVLSQVGNEPAAAPKEEINGLFAGVREQVASIRAAFDTREDATPDPSDVVETVPTTTPATSTPATTSPNVVIPTLSPESVRALNPRPIQIATTSADTL